MKIELEVNKRYLVTHGSDDGTFEKGDIIKLNKFGFLECLNQSGFLAPMEIEEATKGMKIKNTACNLFYSFNHKITDFDTYAKAWQSGYDTAMEEVESEMKEGAQ
jgi:hypothetical protein